RDYYFKTRNGAREFRLRIKRWKAEQKSPTDTLSFDDSDKRWLAYLRAHVGNLELLPAIVTHWERTAKPITRPLKVEELCKAFVLYRQSKGLDKATLSEDRYISIRSHRALPSRQRAQFAEIQLAQHLEPEQVQAYELKKGQLQQAIEEHCQHIEHLKTQRKAVPKYILVKDLPEQDRFQQLRAERKHFFDTIKLIAYRAETALAHLARDKMHRLDDGRSLIRQVFRTEVDLIPDH